MTNSPAWYAQEYARCSTDPWYFLTTYCYVRVPGEGAVRFKEWEHQKQLLYLLQNHDRIIVLKARQLGVSWFLAAYALWNVLFIDGANVLMFSRRETEATEMKERAKFVWRHLPSFLQLPIGKDNDEMLTFPAKESKIQSFPATENAGIGETSTLVILDEWAAMAYASGLYATILPTVEHGTLIGVSTAKGKGNLFAKIYWDAKAGKNSFVPVFIPYNIVRGRDRAWWEKQAMDMPGYMAHQEYPLHEADAFLVSGTCMFDIEALRAMPTDQYYFFFEGTQTEIYQEYNPTHTYSAGIDTALGVAGGDYSCIQIVDETAGTQAAKLRRRIPLDQFSELALNLCLMYGQPGVIIELQPQGLLVIKVFRDAKYPVHKIYHRSKGNPGWHTTEANRKNILAEFEQAIRTGALTLYSEHTVEECLSFGYNEDKDKFEALSGHDDEVMSMAFAWHMKLSRPQSLDDFQSRSYINSPGTSQLRTIDEINWAAADPFKLTEVIVCPTCNGERYVVDQWGEEVREPCGLCLGYGKMLRRTVDVS